MRIIFHIGMGKTGTTSIQNALAQNAEALTKQKAHYLGMWFDAAGPEFHGLAGFGKFFALSPRAQEKCAEQFYEHVAALSKDGKASTFLFSNESLFQNGPRIEPFLQKLQSLGARLEFIAYVRDPRSWLPSAHTQWALRHKTNKGPVQDFATSAQRLVKFYDGIPFWIEKFQDTTRFREATVDKDVVADFAEAIGIDLALPAHRSLERSEPADTLLRAMYNNRIKEQALPDRFNRAVHDTDAMRMPSSKDMARICFDYGQVERVIAENADVFEFLRDKTGIDFLAAPAEVAPPPDDAELQRRIIDYLIEITFDQAKRIKRLERMVKAQKPD